MVIAPLFLSAKVKVHGVFSKHMVIQQNAKIPVWGWADPNEAITVTTSWGENAITTAMQDSTWQIILKTPKAGGPFSMTIKAENTIVIDDVLSGEVWLCSGQSNMDIELYKLINDAREMKYQPLVEEIRKEVASANDPWIRHIEIPRTPSMYKKKEDFKADWRMAVKGQIDTITATGYYFAKELRKHLNVPVGLVECSFGGSRIQPWISEKTYLKDEKMKNFYLEDREILEARIKAMNSPDWVDAEYQKKLVLWETDKKKYTRPWPTEHPEISKQTPVTLYNGMVSAIIPYTIKGVIWYQGESNSHFMETDYGKYFRAMITDWRKDWGDENLPFYWTQLAAYQQAEVRSDTGWAIVCDQQRRTLELPHTGMAVLNDVGEAEDVHPHNKMDAGKRLALWALGNDYGIKVPEVSGPLYKKSNIKGRKIVLTFSHAGDGLKVAVKHLNKEPVESDEALKWFEICGRDGIWKAATANIVAKNKIEVYSPEVKHPVNVRYAWSSFCDGVNLYNSAGLPAAVFTTAE